MTKKEVIDYINKSDFWLVEGPVVFNTCHPFLAGIANLKKFFTFGFNYIFATKGDYGYQFIDKEENLDTTKKLVELFNKGELKKKYALWEIHRKSALDNFEHLDFLDLEKLSDEKVIKEYLNFFDIFILQWTIPIIFEGTAIYTERFLIPRFREETKGLERRIADDYFSALTQPDDISFSSREQISLLKICEKAAVFKSKLNKLANLKKENPGLYKLIAEHQKQYHWVPNNYLYAKPISISAFFNLVKEELENNTLKEIKEEIKRIEGKK